MTKPGAAQVNELLEAVKAAGITGELPPGDWYTPLALAEQLGLSDTTVRRRLIQLEREGKAERILIAGKIGGKATYWRFIKRTQNSNGRTRKGNI